MSSVETLFAKPRHPYTLGLFRSLPHASQGATRLETIQDSYSFVPEDQPEELAKLIAEFLGGGGAGGTRATTRAGAAGGG